MTLGIGNLTGNLMKPGSMGKPIPGYGIDLVDPDGNPVADTHAKPDACPDA